MITRPSFRNGYSTAKMVPASIIGLMLMTFCMSASDGPWVAMAAVTTSQGSSQAAHPPLPPADATLASMVAQELAKLPVRPKTTTVPSDQSLEEVAAIKRGDYASARRIAEEVLARSNFKNWHFYPWSAFMNSMTRGNDPVLLDHLNEWLRREPKLAIAYLMRAWYYYETAWTVRAEGAGWMIPPDIYQVFKDDTRFAIADARRSISLNTRIPWSYYLVLRAESSEGNSAQAEAAFQEGVKAFPGYYDLYRQRLYSLTPKWNGSVADMYAFVERYAGKAPAQSQLKLLYLQEYAYFMDAASFDCGALKYDRLQECATARLKHLGVPDTVGDGIVTALKSYSASDPIAFANSVWPILSKMASTPGSGKSASGATLQLAASVMGSDNRLSRESGGNSYVLDDVTAQVWAAMGNGANAEKKFRDALADIDATQFADEAQRDEAAATVYDHMTEFSRHTSQYLNAIVYYDAANAVGGANHGDSQHVKCWAYNQLKHYAEGVRECSRVVTQSYGNTLLAHYSLARAYEGLERWDEALAEFAPLADSADNYLRVGAAIEMSVIYGKKKDFAGEARILNQHAYLFDPNMQPPEDLAVSFNNRCHAYMELGELQKALNDCTTSLKYDRIPDAYTKEQELMRRLGTQQNTSL
jgi:hypothetical protein